MHPRGAARSTVGLIRESRHQRHGTHRPSRPICWSVTACRAAGWGFTLSEGALRVGAAALLPAGLSPFTLATQITGFQHALWVMAALLAKNRGISLLAAA